MSRVRMRNIKVEPYTRKAIAAAAAVSLGAIAHELARIATALEGRDD
jgi:hypothetical protein